MKIIEDKNNELLKRKEVKIITESKTSPSIGEAVNLVSKEFKTQEDNIVIRNVKGKFGRKTFLISAFVYGSKEAKEKIERKPKKKKGTEAEKAEEKPAEKQEAKPEKPTEKSVEGSSLETSKPQKQKVSDGSQDLRILKSEDFGGAQKSKKISDKTSEKTAKA